MSTRPTPEPGRNTLAAAPHSLRMGRGWAALLPLLLAGAALALLLGAARPARAAGTVGDGTPGSCTDAAFDAALSGGGLIDFECGSNPVTITISYKLIVTPVTVDGGGLVALSGGRANPLFLVAGGASLRLHNLTVTEGYNSLDSGGAVVSTGGAVVISNSQFISNSTVAGEYGGAIASSGPLTITGSTFRGNYATGGGAIANNAQAWISDTVFQNNTAGDAGGGALYNKPGAAATLDGVSLEHNHTSFEGGSIFNYDASLTLKDSLVFSNTAENLGGGLFNFSGGSLVMTGTTVSDNLAGDAGGGLANYYESIVHASHSTFSGNRATIGGGLVGFQGPVYLTQTLLTGNSATFNGGAIYSTGEVNLTSSQLTGNTAEASGGGMYADEFASALVTASTFSGNEAGGSGGGLFAYHASLELWNTTVSGNSAGGSGGGAFNNTSGLRLRHVTLSGNSAVAGGGLAAAAGATTVLTNTLVANSLAGGNCNAAAITAAKYSLSSDNTCALPPVTNLNGVDPLLNPLAGNGGPTLTHLPKLGSPAIDGVVGADALSVDQRGQPRPAGGGYDIGAVERQLDDTDLAPRLWLPLLNR